MAIRTIDPDAFYAHVDAGAEARESVANDGRPPPGSIRAEAEVLGNILYPGEGDRMPELVGVQTYQASEFQEKVDWMLDRGFLKDAPDYAEVVRSK